MTVKIEYVGIIAVVCLIIGALVGNGFKGTSPATHQHITQDNSHTDMTTMIAQIDHIDDADQLVAIGNQAYDTNNPQIAIPAYEKALRLRPRDPNVLTDLGVMYREVGDYQEAVEQFRKAIEIDPKHTISRFNLGIVLMHNVKDYQGARAAFEAFLKISPAGPESEEARQSIETLKKLE